MDLKFLADEHIDASAVQGLQRAGIDIVKVEEKGLRGEPDSVLLEEALEEERVVVTRDSDFLKLDSDNRHSGIVFLTKPVRTSGLIQEVKKVAVGLGEDDLKDNVVYIP